MTFSFGRRLTRQRRNTSLIDVLNAVSSLANLFLRFFVVVLSPSSNLSNYYRCDFENWYPTQLEGVDFKSSTRFSKFQP